MQTLAAVLCDLHRLSVIVAFHSSILFCFGMFAYLYGTVCSPQQLSDYECCAAALLNCSLYYKNIELISNQPSNVVFAICK